MLLRTDTKFKYLNILLQMSNHFDLTAFDKKESMVMQEFDFNDFWDKPNHSKQSSFFSIENKQKNDFSIGDIDHKPNQPAINNQILKPTNLKPNSRQQQHQPDLNEFNFDFGFKEETKPVSNTSSRISEKQTRPVRRQLNEYNQGDYVDKKQLNDFDTYIKAVKTEISQKVPQSKSTDPKINETNKHQSYESIENKHSYEFNLNDFGQVSKLSKQNSVLSNFDNKSQKSHSSHKSHKSEKQNQFKMEPEKLPYNFEKPVENPFQVHKQKLEIQNNFSLNDFGSVQSSKRGSALSKYSFDKKVVPQQPNKQKQMEFSIGNFQDFNPNQNPSIYSSVIVKKPSNEKVVAEQTKNQNFNVQNNLSLVDFKSVEEKSQKGSEKSIDSIGSAKVQNKNKPTVEKQKQANVSQSQQIYPVFQQRKIQRSLSHKSNKQPQKYNIQATNFPIQADFSKKSGLQEKSHKSSTSQVSKHSNHSNKPESKNLESIKVNLVDTQNLSKHQQFSEGDFADFDKLSKNSSLFSSQIANKNQLKHSDYFMETPKPTIPNNRQQPQIQELQRQPSKEFSLNDFGDPQSLSHRSSILSNQSNKMNRQPDHILQFPDRKHPQNMAKPVFKSNYGLESVSVSRQAVKQQVRQKFKTEQAKIQIDLRKLPEKKSDFSLNDFGSISKNFDSRSSVYESKINLELESKINIKTMKNLQKSKSELQVSKNRQSLTFSDKQKEFGLDSMPSPIKQKKSIDLIESKKSINLFQFQPTRNIEKPNNYQMQFQQPNLKKNPSQKNQEKPHEKSFNQQVIDFFADQPQPEQLHNKEFILQFDQFEGVRNLSSFSNRQSKVSVKQPAQNQINRPSQIENKNVSFKSLSIGDFAEFDPHQAFGLESQVFASNIQAQNKPELNQSPPVFKNQQHNQKPIHSEIREQFIKSKKTFSLNDFPDPDFSQGKSSSVSNKFNVGKQESLIIQQGLERSRSIEDISFQKFDKQGKFYSESGSQPPVTNLEFEKLKKHLSQPKTIDFKNFFKEASENERVASQEEIQWRSKQELEQYITNLKNEKRQRELQHMRQNQIKLEKKAFSKKEQKPENERIYIKKVLTLNQLADKKPYGNILTSDILNYEYVEPPREIEIIEVDSKKQNQQSEDFFNFEEDRDIVEIPTKSKTQPLKKPLKDTKLTTIREQNSNIFEKTVEQQKINKLYKTYDKLRENFDLLIGEIKQSRQSQQFLIKQITSLKTDYKTSQQNEQMMLEEKIRSKQSQKLNLMEKEKQRSKKEFAEIKKQIETIKVTHRKDENIERQIIDKISKLEQVVKKSFEQLNQSKNRYIGSPINDKTNELFDKFTEREHQSKQIDESRKIIQMIESKQIPENNKISPRIVVSPRAQKLELYSPLQLKLQSYGEQSMENKYTKSYIFPAQKPAQQKKLQQFAKEYTPKHIRPEFNFKNLCCQQHSPIYESFQFLMTAKYSIVKSGKQKNLKINITIKNKTIIAINDLIVIVYGSVGQVLSVNPSKIYAQKLLPQTSITLDIYLNNIQLQNQFINMQISYKGQRNSKKKILAKIPRPLTKFFDIKFTHEDQFKQIWNQMKNESYLQSKLLNFQLIRSSEDIKIIFPFIDISEEDQRQFGYGLLFNLYNLEGLYLLKLLCSVDGKAELHIRYETQKLRPYAESILDILNYMLFM